MVREYSKKMAFSLMVFVMFLFAAAFVSADDNDPIITVHNSAVTISPDSAHCGNIPNEFTVHVENLGPDPIFEVRIFSDLTGISTFECGEPPTGWDLALFYDGYCEYKTARNSSQRIFTNQTKDFFFNATLTQDECTTIFQIGTLDMGQPGDIRYHYPELDIDCSDPIIEKHVSTPRIPIDQQCTNPSGNSEDGACDFWVTSETDLQFSARDDQSVCDLGIDYCEYQITLDGTPQGWVEWDYEGKLINFEEDSNHYLELRCYDKAGNLAILTETDKVDTTPPTTEKEYIGPYKTDEETGAEWIDSVSQIQLTAEDGGPICHIDGVETFYQYHYYSEDDFYCESLANCDEFKTSFHEDEDWQLYTAPIPSGEESCHVIEFYSKDALGNNESVQHQCVFVDKTPPVLEKEVGIPKVDVDVELGTSGEGVAEMSDDVVYEGDNSYHLYAPLIVEGTNEGRIEVPLDMTLGELESIMWQAYVIQGYTPHADVLIDTDGDGMADDALVFEYDKVITPSDQLIGDMNYQYNTWINTFDDKGVVDDSAGAWLNSGAPGPLGGEDFIFGTLTDWKAGTVDASVDSNTKVVGLEIEVDGWIVESEAYIDLIKVNGFGIPFHWVKTDTTIEFACNDLEPHPSGGETLCYKVSYDEPEWGYITEQYCDIDLTDDGYCCVDVSESNYVLNFKEESMHDLEYYCEDAVEKRTLLYYQYYKVDDTAPTILKTMIGDDHLGQCPPANGEDTCYVRDHGENGVNITVVDGGEICAVDQMSCRYQVRWFTDENTCIKEGYNYNEELDFCIVESEDFSNYAEVIFTEDSTHELYVYCQDGLGNYVEDSEIFLVDSNPPESEKWYGEPQWLGPYPKYCEYLDALIDTIVPEANINIGCGWARWITSQTPVYLNATDEKVGVDKIYWRNMLVTDDEAGDMICGHLPDIDIEQIIADVEMCADAEVDCVPTTYCDPEYYSQFVDLNTSWNEYNNTPFYKEEDSCHIIEYKSVDLLGNEEEFKWQCVFVDNQAPDMDKIIGEPHVRICEAGPEVGPEITDVDTVESFFFTLQDVIFFGYEDGTYIELYNSADSLVWNGTLDREDMVTVNVAEGIYKSVGTEKYSVLVGSPLSQGCSGFYALDEEGLGASTDVFTHTSNQVCQERFIVFSYDDNNDYEVRNVDTDAVLSSGTLNNGERWTAVDNGGQQVHVTSDYPVTVLTLDDQGYFIPGPDGLFSGQFFYTMVMGGGYHDINAYAYYDDTTVTFRNTDTNAVIATDTLDKGETLGWTANSDTYVTIESDKDITASVQPFVSKTTGYHEGSYAGDRDGSGIGLEFMVPAWTGDDGFVWVFGYADDTDVNVYNADTGVLMSSHNLDRGDAINVQNGHIIHQIVANKGVSVYTGWGEWSASFAPVAFGEEACLDLDQDGICDPVDNCPDDYNPGQEDSNSNGIGDVCEQNEGVCWDYISTQTPITFSCADSLPHPVDHVEMYYRYRFSDDCADWNNWTNWTMPESLEWSDDHYRVNGTIYFNQDSCHEIEYYCVDGLGNMGEVMTETDIVDTKSPVITKEVVGPQIGECPPTEEGDHCQIDGVTEIHVTVEDQQPHPVDRVSCEWWYNVYENDYLVFESDVFKEDGSWIINFPEESDHLLTIYCQDGLGNEVRDVEWFTVDKTPPYTWKTFGEPFYTDGEAEYVNLQTPIWLNATDAEGPHDSGVDATYYRISLVDDMYCQNQTICQEAEGDGEFTMYTGTPFNMEEESCHLIEYYSVDGVDKIEDVKNNCVFVDNTEPFTNKTVGLPRAPMSYDNKVLGSNFYPELNPDGEDICSESEDKCWDITMWTPVDLDCADQLPHPSGAVDVCFKIGLDGSDAIEEYCDEEGEMKDGYCCVEDLKTTITFGEESWHKLEYYCIDNVRNVGEPDIEYFKVGDKPFEIKLNKKWNLISVPLKLADESMDAVFASIADKVVTVWQFDGYDWHVYTPDGNPNNDDITTMHPGWGYWILTTDEANLSILGDWIEPSITPPSVPIVHGWNLIGYFDTMGKTGYYGPVSPNSPVGSTTPAYCTLATLRTATWDTNTPYLATWWEPYNPDQLVELYPGNLLDEGDWMDAGAGYWLFYTEPAGAIYTKSGTCAPYLNP